MVLIRDLNFKLSDRAPPDKIALAEEGTVLCVTVSLVSKLNESQIVPPSASAIWSGGARSLSLKFKSRIKTIEDTVHGEAKRSSICRKISRSRAVVTGFGSQRALSRNPRNIWFSRSSFGEDPSIIREFIELRVQMVR